MSDNEGKNVSLINLGSLAKPLDTATKGIVEGAGAFLSRICLPAAEEFGLYLKDKVSHWRALNLAKIAKKAEAKVKENSDVQDQHAHPRLVWLTLEHGSWTDINEVQEMWAGLLASSCTKDGKDESNLIFINLLSQLTTSEVKILNYVCENADKVANTIGVVKAYTVELSKEKLTEITQVDDVYRIDRELDHLNALDLIKGTFGSKAESEDDYRYEEETWGEEKSWENAIIEIPDLTVANIAPTALGINLYVRCQGSLLPPVEFFKLPI